MALWRQLTRGLRTLVNRTAADRNVADEVEHYLHEATSAFEAEGLTPEEARRAARRQVGRSAAHVYDARVGESARDPIGRDGAVIECRVAGLVLKRRNHHAFGFE